MGKSIGNVGLLDLTSATEESIKGIDNIGNAGVVLYSSGNAHLVSMLNIGNLGTSEEVPEGCKFLQGKVEMDGKYFENVKEPLSLFIAGQVIIKPDVTEDDIENKIKFLSISGQAICPEKLAGVLQSKCSKIQGIIVPYSDNCYINIGKLNIDNSFLKSIGEKTSLAVVGKVSMVDDIDHVLLDQKIDSINITGKALIREEYLDILGARIKSSASCKLGVIPAGYVYTDGDLSLDPVTIKKFDKAKIYVSSMLRFGSDITEEMLKEHITDIKAKGIIVCSNSIKEAVSMLCSDTAKICGYSKKAVVIDGDHTIMESELKYSPDNISYIVNGDLDIDDEVLPETFIEKVESIDNFGDITCDKEHYGLVQLKLRTNEGDVSVRKNAADENEGIGNIGYLKL